MAIAQSLRRAYFSTQVKAWEQVIKWAPESTIVKARLSGTGEPPRLAVGLSNAAIQDAVLIATRGDTYRMFAYFTEMVQNNPHLQQEIGKKIMAFVGQREIIEPFDINDKNDQIAAEICEDLAHDCENWIDGLIGLAQGHVWPIVVAEKICERVEDYKQTKFRHPVQWRLKKIFHVPWTLLTYRIAYTDTGTGGTGAAPLMDDYRAVNQGDDWNPDMEWNPDDWHPDLRIYGTTGQGMIDFNLANCYKADPMRHIVHKAALSTLSMRDNLGGILRALLPWHLLYVCARDWFGRSMERYGSPFLVAYANINDKKLKDLLTKAFEESSVMHGIMVPQAAKIELKEAMANGMADGYEKLISRCCTEMTKAIMLQTLSTEAKGTGMGSGVSDLQGDIRSDARQMDESQFGRMELNQIYEWFLKINGYTGRIRCPIRGGLSSTEKAALGKTAASLASAGIFFDKTEETNLSRQFGARLKIYGPDDMAKMQAAAKPQGNPAGQTGGNQHHS